MGFMQSRQVALSALLFVCTASCGPSHIEFLDARTMEPSAWLATTHCGPAITIDPITLDDLSDTGEGLLAVHVTGTVRDSIADLVPGHAADITKVTMHHRSIPVTRVSGLKPTHARPYPFEGRFDGVVHVALADGEKTFMLVTEPNVLGFAGAADFTIKSHLEKFERGLGLDRGFDYRMVIDSISMGHDCPGGGNFNPYHVRITGMRRGWDKEVTIAGVTMPLKKQPGQQRGTYITREPFVVLDGPARISDPHLVVDDGTAMMYQYGPK
jgi:hypothetical protein